MDVKRILSHTDHTLLRPEATTADILRLCDEAVEYAVASVCVNSRYVPAAAGRLAGRIPVCTVVGFPLGACPTMIKERETALAVEQGAREIDMVLSVGDLLEGDTRAVEREIAAVKKAAQGRLLKVIVETCLLTEAQKRAACRAVEAAGADYIKTSTGFSTGGATFEDVALFASLLGGRVKIKASGGLSSLSDMERYLDIGADRLGSSGAVRLVRALG